MPINDPTEYWGPEGLTCSACVFGSWVPNDIRPGSPCTMFPCTYVFDWWVAEAIGECGFCGGSLDEDMDCPRCNPGDKEVL